MKNLVDTHIHLYDDSYNENRDEIINEIGKKLDFVVNISCDYESSKKCIEYAKNYDFMQVLVIILVIFLSMTKKKWKNY